MTDQTLVINKLISHKAAIQQLSDISASVQENTDRIGDSRCNDLAQHHYNTLWQNLSLPQQVEIIVDELNNILESYNRKEEDNLRLLSAKKEFERVSRAVEAEHATALQVWDRKYIHDLAAKQNALDFQVKQSSETIAHLEEDLLKQEEQFNMEFEQLKQTHQKEQKRLLELHEKNQTFLKKEIQSRNKALVARDAMSQLTDGELKSMFNTLVHEVDVLARLKWTLNRSAWTEQLQTQLSSSPKKLQRHILQDTIWTILFDTVFCSPFRILGAEGSSLEQQWVETFGKGTIPITRNTTYTWPAPSFECERWRFEILRQCQQALEHTLSEYDPRQKLHTGYKETLLRAQTDILQQLGNVSEPNEAVSQSVMAIVEKAASMWVTFGSQRCRLLVTIHGLRVTTEHRETSRSGDRSVELVVRPELRRGGDANGELHFEEAKSIAGCEGEIIEILYSTS